MYIIHSAQNLYSHLLNLNFCVVQIKGRDVDESAIDEAASDMALESEEDF